MGNERMNASEAEVVARIAADNAAAVAFPKMTYADDAPVGKIAQRMLDGEYDRAMLVSEIERMTGLRVTIPPTHSKRILCVIPRHGYWSSELTLPDQVFRAAGYEVDYVTPWGGRPYVYGVSLDQSFRDQAWNAAQVSPAESALGKRYTDANSNEGAQVDKARSLRAWVPYTPRPKDGEGAREPYRAKLDRALREVATNYAAMFIVGGGGCYMDLGGDTSIRPIIHVLSELGRPVIGICYGVSVLIQATDPKSKRPLVYGRIVTGHSEQDDYMEGTSDVPSEGTYGPDYGCAPMTLEQMIKQYTGPSGGFVSKDGSPYMAVADGPFISGRTTPDGYPAALLALAQMHGQGLPTRFVIDGDERGHVPSASDIKISTSKI
jgi:putative intracellular protease/amidase